jgi:hypothetical protein
MRSQMKTGSIRSGAGAGRRGRRLLAVLMGSALVAMSVAPGAQADFGVTAFGGSTSINGDFSRQAGAHPDLTTRVEFPVHTDPVTGAKSLEGNIKDVDVSLPPGLVGNPTAVPACDYAELVGAGTDGEDSNCAVETQVGVVYLGALNGGEDFVPVFNVKRPPDAPALLGFTYFGSVVTITPQLRPADYGVVTHTGPTSEGLPIRSATVTLWGVPADPSHDPLRFFRNGWSSGKRGISSTAPRRPFITSATSCPGGPAVTSVDATSWQAPTVVSHGSFDRDFDGVPFITEGCHRLRFEPTIAVDPGSHEAAAPTGLSVNLKVPQSEDPDGLATADVRRVVTTLPQGMSVSASAAAGLGACSPAQIGIGSNGPPTCPGSANIGSVKIKTPLLDEAIEGNVILAKQHENPFGSLLAIYLAVKGPGFYLKLPGRIEADPQTGQLTTVFDNTPQLPFEELTLSLRGGSKAPLVAPSSCGTYSTHVEMTSWASPVPVPLDAPMAITEGCGTGGFAPKLRAGTASPIGGKPSPFNLQVTREDGEQNIARIDTTLPEGVLAKLAGVPLCGDAAAATGSCPAASQVGTTTIGAGAGPLPIYVPEAGKAPTAVYLAGPYKGAPYSLVVKVPAQAGPFDLGTVTVRNAIDVDPVTTQVSVKSDPLPQILEGIPIAYRDVRVEVSRPDFTLNPTSCDAMRVEATVVSSGGKSASPSAPFQAASCERLGFQPKLALSLAGPTHRSAHPKLRAVVTARKGDANIGRAQVTLPKTEFLENAHIQTICTRVQFAADACPAKSVYGYAKAWSPLLDKPLQGPVYLRSSSHELPDLVASLDGQIHVDLQGRIDSVRSRIRNTFDFVPDAPVSKFVLTMQGGKKGLLVNNTELCKAVPRAEVAFDGQNGKTSDSNPVAKTDCGKGRKASK